MDFAQLISVRLYVDDKGGDLITSAAWKTSKFLLGSWRCCVAVYEIVRIFLIAVKVYLFTALGPAPCSASWSFEIGSWVGKSWFIVPAVRLGFSRDARMIGQRTEKQEEAQTPGSKESTEPGGSLRLLRTP